MSVWHYPRLIHTNANCRAGMVPSAWTWTQMVAAENHLTAYRHRELYAKALELGTDTTGVTSLFGRCRFRTGYGVSKCTIVLLMGLTDASVGAGSTANPVAYADFKIAGGATTTVGPFAGGVQTAGVGTILDAPDEQYVLSADVAVTEATAYEVYVYPSVYARILSILIYEKGTTTIDESVNFMNTHAPTGGSPVYDADRQRLAEGLSKQYRQNGGIVSHWSPFGGTAVTRSSATFASLVDSTTGTPTAGTSNGVYLDPRYHRTASRTTVPFEWGVYASMSAGSGTCRIIDTAGTTVGSITVNSATPQWWTATFSLAEASEIYIVPQFAGDGVNTMSVYASSIIEWEG